MIPEGYVEQKEQFIHQKALEARKGRRMGDIKTLTISTKGKSVTMAAKDFDAVTNMKGKELEQTLNLAKERERMEAIPIKEEPGLAEEKIELDIIKAVREHLNAAIEHVGATLGKARIAVAVEFRWDEKDEAYFYVPPVPTLTLAEPKQKQFAKITKVHGETQLYLPGI